MPAHQIAVIAELLAAAVLLVALLSCLVHRAPDDQQWWRS